MKAPTLFGKRMQRDHLGAWWRGVQPVRTEVWGDGLGCYSMSIGHHAWHGFGSAQAAANDAERYLRRLKKQLERIGA